MMPHVICVGIVTLDQVYEVPPFKGASDKIVARSYNRRAGGMAATAAAAVARLGGKADFWGRVGNDDIGDFLALELRNACVGIDGLLRCATGRSPNSAILKSPDGERLIAAFPGSDFSVRPQDLPLGAIEKETIVLADVRWPEAGVAAFQRAHSVGALTVLDADVGKRDDMISLGRHADHIIFSEPGLTTFAGTEELSEAMVFAREHFKGTLSVTCGAAGVKVLQGDDIKGLHAPSITPVDTTGAGDVFHGAFCLALARQNTFEDAIRYASAAAAAKCMNGSGWNALPDHEQTDGLAAATYGRNK